MQTDEFLALLKHYPDCVLDERRFTAYVRDYFPNSQKECNILISLYHLGIVKDLKSVKQIDQSFCYRYKKALMETYGVVELFAEEAVKLWCVCYGQKILKKTVMTMELSSAVNGGQGGKIRYGEKLRTYANYDFSVVIPTITVLDEGVLVKFSIRFKPNAQTNLALDLGRIEDQVKNIYFAHPADCVFSKKGIHAVEVEIATSNRKPMWRNAKFSLVLLSSAGNKYEVHYQCDGPHKLQFEYVMVQKMTAEDEARYLEIVANSLKKNSKNEQEDSAQETQMKDGDETPLYTTPTLEEYKKALLREMYFLKNHGGRKFKVTNGVRLGNGKNVYPYRFEVETEMNLSDDAPLTLTSGGREAAGSVLMCEGFEIIITIDQDLGSKIGSAYISVEPWKLLEVQVNRLNRISKLDRIAVKLLEEGPKLATKETYLNILKGQDVAKKKAMKEDITIIWGPPGTGKTYTMSEIAIDFLKQNKSVLVVSHSNISVDGVVKKIAELMRADQMDPLLKKGTVLRYGYVRDDDLTNDVDTVAFNFALNKDPQLKNERDQLLQQKDVLWKKGQQNSEQMVSIEKRLKDIRVKIRMLESRYVEKAQIVATTISKVNIDKLLDGKKYDVVMFDEVSMAYVPQILCAATYAKEHLIAVGDFRQLAPIAQSESRNILEVDIFSYLKIADEYAIYNHPWLVMLNEQRRMYPTISAFPNRYVYHNLLKDHKWAEKNRIGIVKQQPFAGLAINLIDLSGTYCAAGKNSDNSRFNILSAIISFSTAIKAENAGGSSVGIITPYAAQTRLVRAMLRDYNSVENTQIACSTVHQFQGSERDVIVFDAVESYPSQKVGWLMSKNDNGHVTRLINVAVTRAKGKLITVANRNFWMRKFEGTNHIFYRLIQYLGDKGSTISVKDGILANYIKSLDTGKNIRFYPIIGDSINQLLKDIQKAHEKIVVSIPDGNLDKETSGMILKVFQQAHTDGIRILMKSNDYTSLPESWKAYCWGTEDAVFPLILIDDKVIWYGLPDAKEVFRDGSYSYATVCKTIFRITGEHTIEIIKALTGLENRMIDNHSKILTEKTSQDLQNISADKDDGKQVGGLGRFVEEYSKCPKCKQAMKLMKGRSGKSFLKCSVCGELAYLTPDFTNWYISKESVRCPIHHCDIEAKLGQYGIYIKCEKGHYIKPDEI